MTAHSHREFVDGCFRCDLSREEAREYEKSTPTTEEVEEMLVDLPPGQIEGSVESRRFRRWLAAELAAAEQRGAVRALREAAEALSRQPNTCKSPGCHRADQIILEDRADRIEEDRDHALAEARAALTAAGLLIEGEDHE